MVQNATDDNETAQEDVQKIAIIEIFPPEDNETYYIMDDDTVVELATSDSEFLFQNLIEEEYADEQADNENDDFIEISQENKVKMTEENTQENEKEAVADMEPVSNMGPVSNMELVANMEPVSNMELVANMESVANMEISKEEIIDDNLNDKKHKDDVKTTAANTGKEIIKKRGTQIVKKRFVEPVWRCILCRDTLPSERILKMHHGLHMSCTKCKELILDTDLLLEHFAKCTTPEVDVVNLTPTKPIKPRVGGRKVYICEKCGHTFMRKPEYVAHVDRHNSFPRHRCAICYLRFYDSRTVRRHILTHMQTDPQPRFECKNCDQKFKYKSDLTAHKRIEHDKSVICSFCRLFVFPSKLIEHQDSNCKLFINETTKCPICEKVLLFTSFKNHVKINHSHNYRKERRCQFCNVEFESHSTTCKQKTCRNKYLTWKCDKCGQLCFTQKGLNLHKVQCNGISNIQKRLQKSKEKRMQKRMQERMQKIRENKKGIINENEETNQAVKQILLR